MSYIVVIMIKPPPSDFKYWEDQSDEFRDQEGYSPAPLEVLL